MRLTIDSPSPVELSPAVGLADSRWKRPNTRDKSSGDRPRPVSRHRDRGLACPSRPTESSIRPPGGVYLIGVAHEIVDRLPQPVMVGQDH